MEVKRMILYILQVTNGYRTISVHNVLKETAKSYKIDYVGFNLMVNDRKWVNRELISKDSINKYTVFSKHIACDSLDELHKAIKSLETDYLSLNNRFYKYYKEVRNND
jgi:hypothetical protein